MIRRGGEWTLLGKAIDGELAGTQLRAGALRERHVVCVGGLPA